MTTALRLSRFIVIAAILAGLLWLVVQHNAEQRRILIVHSYHKDLAWVSELNDGIRQGRNLIKRDTMRNLSIRTHYMDLRNHPDCNFYQLAATDVRFTIDDWEPDVVIIFDDLAQGLVGFNQLRFGAATDQEPFNRDAIAQDLAEWLKEDRCEDPEIGPGYFGLDRPAEDHFPDIVFAGVNGEVDTYGYQFATNVTGIFERKNYAALVETLEVLRDAYEGPVSGIRLLNDTSATATAESQVYRKVDWSPFEPREPAQASTFAAWQEEVRKANDENLMLLVANYQNVRKADEDRIRPSELISWTEREAKLPVLGLNTRFVADGGMITVAISGTEQGRIAMDMAMDAIDGKPPRPYAVARQYTIGMNQSLVRQRDLHLPSIYEAFSARVGKFIDIIDHLYLEQSD